MRDGVNSSAVRLGRGNNFQQTHVARRIKKMRAKPGPAEFVGESFGNLADWQAAGVGCDDRPGLADGLHFPQQRALDFEILDHGLDDPVDVGELFDVVFEIANGDQSGERRLHECGRLGFFRGVESGGGDLVSRRAVGVGRNDVEQITGDAGIGEMRGDAGAHGSGAQDGDFIDALHNQALVKCSNHLNVEEVRGLQC